MHRPVSQRPYRSYTSVGPCKTWMRGGIYHGTMPSKGCALQLALESPLVQVDCSGLMLLCYVILSQHPRRTNYLMWLKFTQLLTALTLPHVKPKREATRPSLSKRVYHLQRDKCSKDLPTKSFCSPSRPAHTIESDASGGQFKGIKRMFENLSKYMYSRQFSILENLHKWVV